MISLAKIIFLLTFSTLLKAQSRRRNVPPVTQLAPVPLNNCPNGVLVRKEYRDMSPAEWTAFKDALLSLQLAPSPDGGRYSEWDWLTRMHLDHVPEAHDHPAFFPWHRAFVSLLEKRLQQINPTITIPYWDWSYDWAAPLKSPIFSPEYGLDVRVGPNGDCRYQRFFPRRHCLTRNYNPSNFTAFYPTETIDALIRTARNYDQVRQRIEWVPHGIVHAAVGGDVGDMTTMQSVNDPIFWLHHSNVDRLWWQWQKSGLRSSRRSSILNPMFDYRGTTTSGSVQISDMLNPFNLSVNDTFLTESLCYTYVPFSRASSGRSRPERGFFLPDPIPESWIRMHGMNLTNIRSSEMMLISLMTTQLQQDDPDMVLIDENDQVVVQSSQ